MREKRQSLSLSELPAGILGGEEVGVYMLASHYSEMYRNKRMSWSELSSKREDWVELEYFTLASQEACYERKLLFASNDSHIQSLRC